MMKTAGEPFRVEVAQEVLDDLAARLARTRWPQSVAGDAGWSLGTKADYAHRLAERWQDGFDWRRWEARLNRFEQRMIDVDGQKVHTLIEPGSGADPLPLLLVHGWPGSIFEFIDLIEPLAHPERFGGLAEDGFTVIVPSIPGFGFSPAPPRIWQPADYGLLWHRLMVDALQVKRYVGAGGDKGAMTLSALGLYQPQKLRALHLTMPGLFPYGELDTPLSDAEKAWLGAQAQAQAREGGYSHVQSTRPQSLAYGLTDSPMGLAGWIVEKFHAWTIPGEDRDPPFDMDHLLANVTLYWITGINAANHGYVAYRDIGSLAAPRGKKVAVPTGFLFFPGDLIPTPPRAMLERFYNVVDIDKAPRGGHFPAMEQGELLVEELRCFFRPYRGGPT